MIEEFTLIDNKNIDIKNQHNANPLIKIREIISGMKIIVVNDKGEDITDSFYKEDTLIQYYLIKSKICKYKYVNLDYEKKIKSNDVYIYKTILYPPKSTPP